MTRFIFDGSSTPSVEWVEQAINTVIRNMPHRKFSDGAAQRIAKRWPRLFTKPHAIDWLADNLQSEMFADSVCGQP